MVDLHISAGSVDVHVHGACTAFDRSEDPRYMSRARVALCIGCDALIKMMYHMWI